MSTPDIATNTGQRTDDIAMRETRESASVARVGVDANSHQQPSLPGLEMTGNAEEPYGADMSGLGSDGQTPPAEATKDGEVLPSAPSPDTEASAPPQERGGKSSVTGTT